MNTLGQKQWLRDSERSSGSLRSRFGISASAAALLHRFLCPLAQNANGDDNSHSYSNGGAKTNPDTKATADTAASPIGRSVIWNH